MIEDQDDARRSIRLMMDYGVDMPIWGDDHFGDDEGLELSDALRADLRAFADRWEASIPPETFEDRWDGVLVFGVLVDTSRSIRWWLDSERRRESARKDEAIRAEGESLRRRLQAELGAEFDVTYQH